MIQLPIIGYTHTLHAAGGDTIKAHVAAPSGGFKARLVTLAATPEGRKPVESVIDGDYTSEDWPIRPGSCMIVPGGLPCPVSPHIELWAWPTRPSDGRDQGLLCWGPQHGLYLDRNGQLVARWGETVLTLPVTMLERRWSRIVLLADGERLTLECLTRDGGDSSASAEGLMTPSSGPEDFRLAAIAGNDDGFYDGKIARPVVHDGGTLLAEFALGGQPGSNEVAARGAKRGLLVNRPQKGMTGPEWRGDSVGWQDAPEEYDAIAFHSDDLVDADWPTSFELKIPDDLPSGPYGFELVAEQGSDVLPFFVTASAKRQTAELAFVVPILSYLAYANERHWWPNPGVEAIAGKPLDELIGTLERWAEARHLISAYDYHADGSGNAHASLRRPLVNVRADYIHPLLRGPHQLSGDIITLDWLRETDQPVDILTDYCLHERGAAALAPYRAVMTGSHPEYATAAMLDAYAGYMDGGGSVIHLGGNAFYFVTSIFADEPHVIEVRRGIAGTIPWQSEPGEWRQAATGELSGLWRWRGRSAHALFGAGTAAVSFDPGAPYKREVASHDPAHAWIFAGTSGDPIAAVGSLLGGAAGFEVDAIRHDLGTPADTVRLATAGLTGPSSFLPPEDVLGTGSRGTAESHILYRALPGGGELFAAPSIAWTSCLTDRGGDNDVARITRNVIDRFLHRDRAA